MKINIENFKRIITKATLNFGIESLQLRLGDRIVSDSINQNGTSISILDIENNLLDTREELVFNFGDPANSVLRFINLINDDEVNVSLTDLFMILKDSEKQFYKLGFVSDAAVKRLGTDDVKNVEWFHEAEITKDIVRKFEKIKKIGSIFGKVYIDVKDKKLYIDTTDKTNRYSPGVKFKLADIDMDDISLAYTYTDMVNFFHCVQMDIEKTFTMKISFDKDQGLGCLYAHSANNEEKYALISRDSL